MNILLVVSAVALYLAAFGYIAVKTGARRVPGADRVGSLLWAGALCTTALLFASVVIPDGGPVPVWILPAALGIVLAAHIHVVWPRRADALAELRRFFT